MPPTAKYLAELQQRANWCGHFPDGAEKFTKTDMVGESRGQWYLRQMLGSANFDAGPTLAFMSGNLCYRPSTTSIRTCRATGFSAVRVRALCDNYDLPYTTGSFLLQSGKTCSLAKPRCRTSICATPPTTPRKPAASGFHPTRARIRPHRPGDRPRRGFRHPSRRCGDHAVTVPPSGAPSRLRHRLAPRAAVGRPDPGRRRTRSTIQDAADLVARFRRA